MPHYVVDKIAEALNTKRKAINGSKILIAGVAYKRDIDDMRESPALDVMGLLHARGADVSYVDPHVPEVHGREWSGRFDIKARRRRAAVDFGKYDCIVVVTDHKSFDYEAMVAEADLIVDTRNAIKRPSQKVFRLGAPRPEGESGGGSVALTLRRGDTEEPGRLGPDQVEAAQQLMIVVEKVELDVRARSRPALHRRRIDCGIPRALKNQDRLLDAGVERVVASSRPNTARSARARAGRNRSGRSGACRCGATRPARDRRDRASGCRRSRAPAPAGSCDRPGQAPAPRH